MPRKILFADDSATIRSIAAAVLGGDDIVLITAGNGDEALEKAAAERPDLVFADTDMPGMDGFSLSEALKSDPSFRNTPVVLLAGTFVNPDPEKIRLAGADGTLKKPFESRSLLALVRKFIPETVMDATKNRTVFETVSAAPGPAHAVSETEPGPILFDENMLPLNAEITLHVEDGADEAVPAAEIPAAGPGPACAAQGSGYAPEELRNLVRTVIEDIVERIAREVVPEMADRIIWEELERRLAGRPIQDCQLQIGGKT
jgi:CheY-like chemotaxis protein